MGPNASLSILIGLVTYALSSIYNIATHSGHITRTMRQDNDFDALMTGVAVAIVSYILLSNRRPTLQRPAQPNHLDDTTTTANNIVNTVPGQPVYVIEGTITQNESTARLVFANSHRTFTLWVPPTQTNNQNLNAIMIEYPGGARMGVGVAVNHGEQASDNRNNTTPSF